MTPEGPGVETSTAAPPEASRHSLLRRFIETAILFISMIAIVRAIALEPFGVPTGSMAHTLVGNHKACHCPRCGYPVVVGSASNGTSKSTRDPYRRASCPNCGESPLRFDAVRECIGDRLLVDKNVFELRKPRRWEVAVFRCPYDGNKPYVKRIVGLPGETVLLRNGDLVINNALVRKSIDECRAVRVELFDNNYQPADRGWRQRWRTLPQEPTSADWQSAMLNVADAFVNRSELQVDEQNADAWLIYRHWLLDENQEAHLRDDFGYNGGDLPHRLNTVHDFAIEFDLQAERSNGSVEVALWDGHDEICAILSVDSARRTQLVHARTGEVLSASESHLRSGQTHRVEYYFFDRRAALVIDGRQVLTCDLPEVGHRQPVSRPFRLRGRDVSLTIRNFRLFRDIHYGATGGDCRNGVYEPWPLGPDEYFLLGDNSANSQDSRFWTDAGVPERYFMGKPLLLHQPSQWTHVRNWEIECIDLKRVRWIR